MRQVESKLSIIFNLILGPRISFVKLRVLSKSQNWPARLWLDKSFWQSNGLFPRVFAEKASPLSILFRIWLMWLDSFYCERFEPRSHFKSRLSLIIRVNIVLNRTVVVDSDWRFDNLCGSHLRSQSELYQVSWWYYTLVIVVINSEILFVTGMVWPVRSDKWKEPKDVHHIGVHYTGCH